MQKKLRVIPRLVSLDLTKPEANVLRDHVLAGRATSKSESGGRKLVFARIVSGSHPPKVKA